MEDREFFDHLLQVWAKTTGAEDRYWAPVETGYEDWDVFAVGKDEQTHFVGYFENDADSDFVTAIHGCLPDLVRRLHDAVDTAERLDAEMDICQGRLAAAEMRVDELMGGAGVRTTD